jgi:hypothetical protein
MASAANAIFEREILDLRLTGALLEAFNDWTQASIDALLAGMPDRSTEQIRDLLKSATPDSANDTIDQYFDRLDVFKEVKEVLAKVKELGEARRMSEAETRRLMRTAVAVDKGVFVPLPQQALAQASSRVPQLVPAPHLNIPDHPAMLAPDIPFAQTGVTYKSQLERVGRTVATAVHGRTARALAEQTGQDLRWVTMGDHRVRSSHRAAQGQTVPYDEWFQVGGIPMEFPGDPSAPEDETINCRCVLTLVAPPDRRFVQSITARQVEHALAAAAKPDPEDLPEPLFDIEEGEGERQRWETHAEHEARTNPSLTAAAPNQARAPKGTAIGGQWIDTPGGTLADIQRSAAAGASVSVDVGGATYTGTAAPQHGREADIRAHGYTTPTLYHSHGDPESTQAFQNAIQRAKDGNPYGASVYVYPTEDYRDMDLWLTADGTAGAALHGDDIVSVFNTGTNPANKGFVQHAMATAQAAGGTHADAFDTVLPKLYAQAGMTTVARVPWNDEYAPPDWDYDTFAKFNGGRPDVVFLKYDPQAWWGTYTPGQGQTVTDYDEGVALTASVESHVDGLVVPLLGPRLSNLLLADRGAAEEPLHEIVPVLLRPSHPDTLQPEPGSNPGSEFAPTQARAPKGTDIGGQWVDTPGGLLKGIGVRENLTLGFAPAPALSHARDVAKSKAAALPTPTDADRAAAAERHAKSKRHGGDDRPGSQRRKQLRQGMLDEYGDGTTCPCVNCGRTLDITTVSMDRIIPGADNGRYVPANLIPMDYDCNRARSDSDFSDMSSTWATNPSLPTGPVVPLGTTVHARVSGYGVDESGDLGGADDAPSLDGVPEWVDGPLVGQAVPGYYKHIVGGYDVDPASIEEVQP